MAKTITPKEQVYVTPPDPPDKIYIYLFLNKALWKRFHTHPPYKNNPLHTYLKKLISQSNK